MASREDPIVTAHRRIAEDLQAVTGDLRGTRYEIGLSQELVAHRAGVSRSELSRIERSAVATAVIDRLASVAAVLGMRLRINLYPEGEPLRDRVQAPGLELVRKRLHPSMAWRSEVVLPGQGDRRAWDAVAIDEERIWTGFEWISRVGAIDAMLRRTNQKQRDDPRISRVVLVIADTRRNRAALRLALAAVREGFPLGTRDVLTALAAGHAPALNGIVLLRVPSTRPHAVHRGGKVVDVAAHGPGMFVENPVGWSFTGP
jgi:transcriptional regulator with XRE-family HTH domain